MPVPRLDENDSEEVGQPRELTQPEQALEQAEMSPAPASDGPIMHSHTCMQAWVSVAP